jgi:hypothetical protein
MSCVPSPLQCAPNQEMNDTPQYAERWAENLANEEAAKTRNHHLRKNNNKTHPHPSNHKLSLFGAMFGECFCGPLSIGDMKGLGQSSQFIELHGIQFIGLGAVMDELTPKERVYDTLEQLSSRTQRMISIGYLVDDEKIPGQKISESIPLDVWNKTYPDDKTMSRHVRRTIASIKVRRSIV